MPRTSYDRIIRHLSLKYLPGLERIGYFLPLFVGALKYTEIIYMLCPVLHIKKYGL